MKKLENRVAVITGGSRGIGKGIALTFAKEGAHIVFSYNRNKEAAENTAKEIESLGVKALAVQANAGNEDDVKKMAEITAKEFGKINILVNNAGTIGLEVPVSEMETSEWDRVINTDLRGVFLSCKYFIPLIESGGSLPVGKIINISSELSKKGRACYGHYAAAKGAINSFTMCLALELAPDILVNIVAPGPVETDMILADMEPEWIEKEKDIPLKRLGSVEEIGAAALLLASDDGNFFCGQFVSPNGGAVFF
ncbi:MAG: SDR family NAD(P)-dependent oxidoreductase [Anaerovoracaceae bacterium]